MLRLAAISPMVSLCCALAVLAVPFATGARAQDKQSPPDDAAEASVQAVVSELRAKYGSATIDTILEGIGDAKNGASAVAWLASRYGDNPEALRGSLLGQRDSLVLKRVLEAEPDSSTTLKLPDLVEHSLPAVARVTTYDANLNRLLNGSGFLIAPDMVLTSRHVLHGARSARIEWVDGTIATVQRMLSPFDWSGDNPPDVIVLVLDSAVGARPLNLSVNGPRIGDRVAIIGNPLGLSATTSDGIVSAIPDIGTIQVTAPISPGSSGSPLLDMQGSVIGVVTSTIPAGDALNFAASVAAVRNAVFVPTTWESLAERLAIEARQRGSRLLRLKQLRGSSTLAELEWIAPTEDEWGLLDEDLLSRAEAWFRDSVSLQSADASAWDLLSQCLVEQGRMADALDCLQTSIALEPSPPSPDSEVYSGLPDTTRDRMRVSDVEEVADRYDRLSNLLWQVEAAAAAEDKRKAVYDPAVTAARQALQLIESVVTDTDALVMWKHLEAQNHLCARLLLAERPGEALAESDKLGKLIDRAATLVREDLVTSIKSDNHLIAGEAFMALGDLERAEARFEQALEATPNHWGALVDLAAVNWMQGDREAARKYLKALETDHKELTSLLRAQYGIEN